LFSTSASHRVRDGATDFRIRPWDVYEFDRSATPRLRRILDAHRLGFNDVVALSFVSEGDLRIAPKRSGWARNDGSRIKLSPSKMYSVNPTNPRNLIPVFDGSTYDLRAINAYSVGDGTSCDDGDARTADSACYRGECRGLGWVSISGIGEDNLSRIEVVESAASHLQLGVSIPGFRLNVPVELEDKLLYTPISAPGGGRFEQCKPSLPVLAETILIPNGTAVTLQVDAGEPMIFEGLDIPPVQMLAEDCEGELSLPFVKCDEIYSANTDSPGLFAELDPSERVRGQETATLWVYPFQYNPVQHSLAVFPDLLVKLVFDGKPKPIPFELQSDDSELMFSRTAINAEAVLTAEDNNQGPLVEPYDKGPPTYGPYGWDYIIITHSKFVPAADKLAAWKNKLGFKAIVWELPPHWLAYDILLALQDAYDTWGRKPEYVLFLGDAEYVPTTYETWHPHNEKAGAVRCDCNACVPEPVYTQGHIGTDLYYATVDGNDDIPDFYLGRLSVDTAQQALDRITEIIQYEQSPVSSSGFYGSATICAEFEDNNLQPGDPPSCPRDTYEDKRFTQTSEDMALFLTQAQYGENKAVDRIYWAESAVNPGFWGLDSKNFGGGPAGGPGQAIPSYLKRSSGFTWDGTGVDLVNALNQGRFLVTYRGHGARDHWRSPRFDDTHFQVLNNGNKLPVIWSFSCQTGWFDNETDFPAILGEPIPTDRTANTDQSFSEKWERHSAGGAIGIVAGTRVTFGFLNEHLSWGMMDAIWPNFLHNAPAGSSQAPIRRMGPVLHYGREYMTKKSKTSYGSKPNEVKANYEAYHWFGDPSLAIRTNPPQLAIAADLPPDWWLLNKRDLPIHVDLLDELVPLDGATVTVTSAASPREYWEGTTDAEGDVVFPNFVAASPGTYDVVVSSPETVPVMGSFEVTAGPAAGIILDGAVYSCSSALTIRLADSNADPGGGDVMGYLSVEASTSGGDEETVAVVPNPDVEGTYVGFLPLHPSEITIGDGTLQVADGDDILVRYVDGDDGQGKVDLAETSAIVDCTAPSFDGLISATQTDGRILLQWQAASDLHPPIRYNVYRGSTPDLGSTSLIATTWTRFFPDPVSYEPDRVWYYLVRAEDAAGNEDANECVMAGCWDNTE
jgi:hypothetical protein